MKKHINIEYVMAAEFSFIQCFVTKLPFQFSLVFKITISRYSRQKKFCFYKYIYAIAKILKTHFNNYMYWCVFIHYKDFYCVFHTFFFVNHSSRFKTLDITVTRLKLYYYPHHFATSYISITGQNNNYKSFTGYCTSSHDWK